MIVNDRIPLDSLGSLGIPEPRSQAVSTIALVVKDPNLDPVPGLEVNVGPADNLPSLLPDGRVSYGRREWASGVTTNKGLYAAILPLPVGTEVLIKIHQPRGMNIDQKQVPDREFKLYTVKPAMVMGVPVPGANRQIAKVMNWGEWSGSKRSSEDKLILPEGEMDLDKREQEKIRGYFTWHAVIVRDGKPVAGVEVELLNGSPGNPFGERGIIEGLGIDEALGRGRTDSQGRVAIPVNPPWSLLGGRRNREESNARAKQLFNMFKGIYAKIYAPGLPESESFFRDVWPVRMEGSENLNPAVQSGDYDISLLDSGRLRAKVKAPTLANPYFINLPPTTKGAGWEEYLPYIMGGVGVLGISTILFLTLKK